MRRPEIERDHWFATMILTCPECATRYFLADDAFGETSRSVRCAACGSSWRASRSDARMDLSFDEPAVPSAPPARETAVAAAAEAPAATGAEPLPKAFRAKVQARKETRKAAAAGVVWGGLGAAVLALLLAAFLFRVDVVRLVPRTAGAYARIGLPVNPVGLSPENVLAAPGLKDGHVAVTVTGTLRNVETRARKATALKISLLDKAGKTLASTVVEPGTEHIEPGKTAPFGASFLDPPTAAAGVRVEFVFEKTVAAKHPIGHGVPIDLRGRAEPALPAPPVAKTAEPLPAESPYALPADPGAGHGGGHAPEHASEPTSLHHEAEAAGLHLSKHG